MRRLITVVMIALATSALAQTSDTLPTSRPLPEHFHAAHRNARTDDSDQSPAYDFRPGRSWRLPQRHPGPWYKTARSSFRPTAASRGRLNASAVQDA